jgi:hypothetical protein
MDGVSAWAAAWRKSCCANGLRCILERIIPAGIRISCGTCVIWGETLYCWASSKDGDMSEWMLRRVTDYWESRANAVFVHAQRLEVIERARRAPVLAEIAHCVNRHADALSSEQLANVGWIMVDDLYRGLGGLSYWDDSIPDYLRASAATFCGRMTSAGYSLRYFVDNEFEQTEVGLAGPAEWYGPWFRAAGFSYICPQEIARRHIIADGFPSARWTDTLTAHLESARTRALDLLRSCRSVRGHFVFLDAESSDTALGLAAEDAGEPGSILVMRNEAPQLSSRCQVSITPPMK